MVIRKDDTVFELVTKTVPRVSINLYNDHRSRIYRISKANATMVAYQSEYITGE